jgi:hypothetical protein
VTNIGLNLEYTPGVSDRSALSELRNAVFSPTVYGSPASAKCTMRIRLICAEKALAGDRRLLGEFHGDNDFRGRERGSATLRQSPSVDGLFLRPCEGNSVHPGTLSSEPDE